MLCAATLAYAGGPFFVDNVGLTGTPQRWGSNRVTWYAEDGELSSLINNSTAKLWVQEALSTWKDVTIRNASNENVSTTSLTVVFGGSVGKDVDLSNYAEYLEGVPGPSIVIFDKDGSIIEDLGLDKTSIVGLAAPLVSNAASTEIVRAFALFNGSMLEGGVLASDREEAEKLFQSTMVHEFGHWLNLDHAQVNVSAAIGCTLGGSCSEGQYIPTMFPELKTSLQKDLNRDDKIAISSLYPSEAFERDFCTIIGQIKDDDGNPLRGVNVIASRVNDGETLTKQDARSMISGVFFPDCADNSTYVLRGIIPGKTYQVTYEPLSSLYAGPSGFEPLDNPPSGFASGTVTSSDDQATVSCSEGGQTVSMKTVQINTRNPCTAFSEVSASDLEVGEDSSSSSSSESNGGCSFIPRP